MSRLIKNVPTPVPGDNPFDINAKKVVTSLAETPVPIGSLQDAIQGVKDAYTANGNQPVDVFLSGHGKTSLITVGGGQHSSTYMEDNNANVQAFTTAFNGKIRNLTLFACHIGENFATNPNHLVKSLATGLHKAGGVAVTVYAPDEDADASPAAPKRAAYLSLDVSYHWVHSTVG